MKTLVLLAALAVGVVGPAAADLGPRVAAAALDQTTRPGVYDPAYVVIDYPMGDVPADRGVCADVVIRALRTQGIDLQRLVHEDMKANFGAYPRRWGLIRPDRNIDHRRVPNLEVFFTRRGWRLPPSDKSADYRPGDIVSWNLKGGDGDLPHIGVVTDRIGRSGRPLIAHNIGAGPKVEDVLFDWTITGRFRPQAD
jgi:hypothetical protein